MTKFCVGVDIGTAFSCVAIARPSGVEIVANEQGNRITPSVCAYTDDEILVGEGARNQAPMNPTNTLYCTKRLIGREFEDADVQEMKRTVPYKIVPGKSKGEGNVLCEVKFRGEQKFVRPEEVAAQVLLRMKKIAEDYVGEKVTDAVITVPAFFSNNQREATKDAARIAGLNVLRIINEPTAAALAYSFLREKSMKEEMTAVVCDLGGGTFDCSILQIEGKCFEVQATKGDLWCGGADCDQKLVDYCVDEIKKKHKHDLKDNKRALSRLAIACERAKKTLSVQQMATVEIDSLFEGKDFTTTITRAKFEDLCADVFRKPFVCIEQAMKQAKLSKSQIDEVICVGGSTRIPKFRQMLKDYFGKDPKVDVNPDEVVAYGAAVQAASLTGMEFAKDSLLLDITPLSLGLEVSGEIMCKIIECGTTIPAKRTQIFTTYEDYQPAVTIQVYEGERTRTRGNKLLGKFDLTGIPKMKRGEPKVEVTFDVDANSILHVTAVEKSSGVEKKIEIKNESGRLTKEEVDRMKKEAAKYAEEDRLHEEKMKAKSEVEHYLYVLKQMCDDEKFKTTVGGKYEELKKQIDEGFTKMHDMSDAVTIDEIKQIKKELEETFAGYFSQAASSSSSMGGDDTQMDSEPPSSNSRSSSASKSSGPKIQEVD